MYLTFAGGVDTGFKMHKQKGIVEIILVLLLVAALGAAGYFYWQKQAFLYKMGLSPATKREVVVCPQDAMKCPNGLYVGRDSGNQCQFMKCDDSTGSEWKTYTSDDFKYQIGYPSSMRIYLGSGEILNLRSLYEGLLGHLVISPFPENFEFKLEDYSPSEGNNIQMDAYFRGAELGIWKNEDDLTLKEFIGQKLPGTFDEKNTDTRAEEMTYAGKSGILVVMSGDSPGMFFFTEKNFILLFAAHSQTEENTRILSTFKFLD